MSDTPGTGKNVGRFFRKKGGCAHNAAIFKKKQTKKHYSLTFITILGHTPVQSQSQDQDHAALKATLVLLLFYCRTMMSMIADCKTVKKIWLSSVVKPYHILVRLNAFF